MIWYLIFLVVLLTLVFIQAGPALAFAVFLLLVLVGKVVKDVEAMSKEISELKDTLSKANEQIISVSNILNNALVREVERNQTQEQEIMNSLISGKLDEFTKAFNSGQTEELIKIAGAIIKKTRRNLSCIKAKDSPGGGGNRPSTPDKSRDRG